MSNINLSEKEILARIGYFRTKKNISAYKLGQELGHSKTYFYRIESGEIKLSLAQFLEVLEILEVSTGEFFAPLVNEKDIDLIECLHHLPSDCRVLIMELAKRLAQQKDSNKM